ncbi:hypothetical protein Patl1_09398 [Pistacia atlantica]|uniref:Uncharacterized protein n=1 Tax=Pistacia atlantica TaxID=434234 RepID=A0ACC1AGF0_9ROSI|nr:hypothetical protein Patl1_09398 [Pistacia atlantica]
MMEKKEKKFLTASAHNDVTVVFRENVGSQHYHYKRDNSPHYTVILGSHRNRRLKIEVDGKTVVDVAGSDTRFQNLVFQWLDSNPNCSVRYVGLSSWDRHVGYRNVNVLPLTHNHILLWKQVDCGEYEGEDNSDEEVKDERTDYEKWGLENFLESWELSDVFFIVGTEEKPVPGHKVILQASGNFPLEDEDVIQLQGVAYPILHALLKYIYTGQTQISEPQLGSLLALSSQFQVMPLDEAPHCCAVFPFGLPISAQRLKLLHSIGKYCDINICIEGHGLVAQSHKIILSLWSVPFAKMFTNGMSESSSSEVHLRDVSFEGFKIMLEFMYGGKLHMEDTTDFGSLLLQLLLLADQFGVTLLHQECCKLFLECLSEGWSSLLVDEGHTTSDSVCPILQAVQSIPSCKLIEETCERKFSMHFDYCTTASLDFVLLDEAAFSSIIQHPDLTVTSEERVLNAILMWCMKAKELSGWETVDELMTKLTAELLFEERLQSVNELLPFLERSNLRRHIAVFDNFVKEAIRFIESGSAELGNNQNVRFQHRRSSFKELLYICDGDSNGVLYFAGTSYGEHQWVNPVLAKRIIITASSPISRFTDPKALASRTYQGTSFAGSRMEDGHNSAWWMVDLGQDHQLMCNYYTLRMDGSRAYIRSWNFQGSMDGRVWTNLRVHENDQTICKPGQFASWPIIGPNALLPFRFFRVVLTGPTSDASNPWNFCICFLELYGYLH